MTASNPMWGTEMGNPGERRKVWDGGNENEKGKKKEKKKIYTTGATTADIGTYMSSEEQGLIGLEWERKRKRKGCQDGHR